METPMQQLFYRIEQLRFAKNPIDELMMIRLQMLEKEKEVIMDAHIEGQRVFDKLPHTQWTNDQAEQYYNQTFNTKER